MFIVVESVNTPYTLRNPPARERRQAETVAAKTKKEKRKDFKRRLEKSIRRQEKRNMSCPKQSSQ